MFYLHFTFTRKIACEFTVERRKLEHSQTAVLAKTSDHHVTTLNVANMPLTPPPQGSQSSITAARTHIEPTNNQNHCPLFALPPELRNRIYSYATSESETESPLDLAPQNKGTQRTYRYNPNPDYTEHVSLEVVNLDYVSDVKPSNALLGTC